MAAVWSEVESRFEASVIALLLGQGLERLWIEAIKKTVAADFR